MLKEWWALCIYSKWNTIPKPRWAKDSLVSLPVCLPGFLVCLESRVIECDTFVRVPCTAGLEWAAWASTACIEVEWNESAWDCVLQVVSGLPEDTPDAPEIPTVQGHTLLGGPQMIQLRYDCCLSLSSRHALQLGVTPLSWNFRQPLFASGNTAMDHDL